MDYEIFKALAEDYKKGMIQITPRCMYNCKFCYNKFLPDKLRRKYQKENHHVDPLSFSKLIRMIPPGSVILGESANFSEGDIMAHSDWQKLVTTTRNFHGDKHIFLSTAKVLSGGEVEFLADNVDELAHTFTSFNPAVHEKLTGGKESGEQIKKMFSAIEKNNLKTRIKIIPMKNYYDWQQIEKDIEKIAAMNSVYCIDILLPGYTRYTDENIKENLDFSKETLAEKIKKFQNKFGDIVQAGNLSVLLNTGKKKKELIEKIKTHTFQDSKILLLVSKRMEPVAEMAVQELKRKNSASIDYLTIENQFLGGNIEVGGLLVVEDYLQKKEEINRAEADVILTTSAPFRYQDNRDLLKVHRSKLEEELNAPIIFI